MSKSILANGTPAQQGSRQPDTPKLAAIYARVSTEDQGKNFSIPTQLAACQALAQREGLHVPTSYILIDEGISGTTLERPSLRALRELIHSHAIAALIVHDPDRLSRNLGHQLMLAEELERANMQLCIVSHLVEHGPEGWLFFQMRGALAEYERAKILERCKRGLVGRAKAGHPNGGQVPLGYLYIMEPHGGRWEIDPEEVPIVRRIFAMCLAGMPARAMARQLSAEGVPHAAGSAPQERREETQSARHLDVEYHPQYLAQ
jgi:site-specific DNA recombinase